MKCLSLGMLRGPLPCSVDAEILPGLSGNEERSLRRVCLLDLASFGLRKLCARPVLKDDRRG